MQYDGQSQAGIYGLTLLYKEPFSIYGGRRMQRHAVQINSSLSFRYAFDKMILNKYLQLTYFWKPSV